VSSTTQDPEPANNTDAGAVVIAPQADLSVVKRAAATVVDLFQDVTYTLTVANAGPNDATGVTIADSVPAGMLFVSADPACTFDAGASSVTCAIDTLARGASRDVTVTLRPQPPNAGQTLTNTATVTGDQPDPSTADNTSSASIFVPPQADLAIAKTVSPTTVAVGGTLTYSLVVTNAGPSTATSVTVDDPLPAGLTATAATAAQGTCTISGRDVRCALGDVPTNGQVEVTIAATVAADAGGTTLDNTATVSSPVTDPRSQDNSSSASATVTPPPPTPHPTPQPPPSPQPTPPPPAPGGGGSPVHAAATKLSLRKRASRARVRAGHAVTYRLTIRNRTGRPAFAVRVCDRLPKGLTVRSAPRAHIKGRTACWRIARLAGHAARTFTIHTLAGDAVGVTRILNRGVASGSNAATVAGRASITVVPDSKRGPQFTG
jgi:uncharacterized repeat protein (TIGR01451 family)